MPLRAVMIGRNGGNIGEYLQAVAAGLRRHGVDVTVGQRFERQADFMICWGWRRGQLLRDDRARVLVLERAYLGQRMQWTSLAWDGLNNRGNFCLPRGSMPDRFNKHFSLLPWKIGGEHVLVMGQVPGDMSLAGRSLKVWYQDALHLARERYGLPAFFRPHPQAVAKGYIRRDPQVSGPIEVELARAAHVITWNSNSGVDAVVAGVPAVTIDPGAMAWPVTSHKIGETIRPDREEWANRLSWCQWLPGELADGAWWERMKAGLRAKEPGLAAPAIGV